ncbi:MAG: hypothetical protein U0183_10925 [Polyangiaceae bacterium]
MADVGRLGSAESPAAHAALGRARRRSAAARAKHEGRRRGMRLSGSEVGRSNGRGSEVADRRRNVGEQGCPHPPDAKKPVAVVVVIVSLGLRGSGRFCFLAPVGLPQNPFSALLFLVT